MSFIRLRKFLSISSLLSVFYHEAVLDFAKCFFCVCWNDHVSFFVFFCVFYLLIWYITLFVFQVIKLTLPTWDKSPLVMTYSPFYMLLIPFASIFILFYFIFRIFVFIFIWICSFPFLWSLSLVLVSG